MFFISGFILSGEYPQKKSSLNFIPDSSSNMGTHTSSVAPGKTVDSKITISPLDKRPPIVLVADFRGLRSGFLNLSIGVGTVTTYIFASLISFVLEVNFKF